MNARDESMIEHQALVFEIEQLFYLEASLLDAGKFEQWLELLTSDVIYQAPQTEFTDRADHSLDAIGAHHFDEDLTSLKNRIEWLTSGLNNSERPPAVRRRLISNVRVLERHEDGSVTVESNFLVWQSRWDDNSVLYVGRREDRLRRQGAALKIARRTTQLANPVLPRSLTTFL
jgi:3-phenylpropionate/cinnamic acid dioxygenase small subunit